MNITQIERQRELLKGIVLDVSDVEQVAFGGDLESKQQAIAEKLCRIRQAALDGINDQEITEGILAGYKKDCLGSLMGLLDMALPLVDETVERFIEEPSDTQMQLLAMAATSYAERFSQYLQIKSDVVRMEVDHG